MRRSASQEQRLRRLRRGEGPRARFCGPAAWRLAPLVCLLALVVRTAGAADIIPKADIDRLVQPVIAGDWCRGLVIGILQDDRTQVVGYGSISDTESHPPDGRTVFEIGSISKVFTATLLADMVERKQLSLADPVQTFLPDSVKVPSRNGKAITLLDLATQHSGLPRMPGNFRPRDPANPYADYTLARMDAFLSGYVLPRDPGAQYEYSNLGVALLGRALALRAGAGYEDLIERRICRPLGMNDTRVTLDPALRARLAPGHNADGDPVPNWDLVNFAPAGGLHSTADDLLKFLAAYAGDAPAELWPAMRLAVIPRASVDFSNDIALCWHVDKALKMRWHNGETGGYRSFVTFSPTRKFGVVVLGNTRSPVVDKIAVQLTLRLAVNRELKAPDLPTAVAIPAPEAQACAGRYQLSPASELKMTCESGKLYCQATGQPRIRLYPESASLFFCKAAAATFTFEKDSTGRTIDVVLHQDGRDRWAERVDLAGRN